MEQDGRRRAVRQRDPPYPAAVARDQRLRVRGERGAGHEVAGEARLLVVALHRPGQPPLAAGDEIPEPEPGLGIEPAGVHQPASVGRQHRPHRAAVEIALHHHLAGLAIVGGELPLREREIVAEAALVARVPDVATVAAEGGPERVDARPVASADRAGAGVGLGQADAVAAVLVVQPELIVGLEPVLLARDDQVAPVRRPLGRRVQRGRALGHLAEPRCRRGQRSIRSPPRRDR